ncbi:MAG: hypothetical protein KGO80_09125, partial [Bacteroidetes bacterium]|nr:hypothetical protein [Bacteroidota bacterium]
KQPVGPDFDISYFLKKTFSCEPISVLNVRAMESTSSSAKPFEEVSKPLLMAVLAKHCVLAYAFGLN